MMSLISSFDIINVICAAEKEWRLLPDPNIFLSIPVSAADADAVNPKGMLLANGVITFFINGKPVF